MVQGIFGSQELALLCRIALFSFRQLLRLACDGMEASLAVWIVVILQQDYADG
jgi:hypothetical protein